MPFRASLPCPQCQTPLTPKLSYDACQNCEGRFVSEETLVSAFQHAQKDSTVELEHCLVLEESNRVISCPMCGDPLTCCSVGGVLIDRCWSSHGFWLDRGEWSAIVKLRENDWIDVASYSTQNDSGKRSWWEIILAALDNNTR